MSPRGTTVNLPKLKRARGGWVVYNSNEDGVCPYHQFCAYSGDEPNLCAVCHTSSHSTSEHGDLPSNRTAPCLCSRCGELFTSVTGFRIHFRPNGKCGNPERRGLILVEQTDREGTTWSLWAKPGSRPEDL